MSRDYCRRQVVGWGIWTMAILLVPVFAVPAYAQKKNKKPTLKQVYAISRAQLGKRDGYQPGDLIHQKDVQGVLKALAANDWQPKDKKQIVADTLPENDALVRILGTRRGVKFMRKVKDYELIFDRMDRVCRVSGGQRMLTDIAKLPDGQKIAKTRRPPGSPGFLDLLPKNSSGKVRSIKDYREPTGRIYTESQLLERLKLSYAGRAPKNAQRR
jgi:hypothetical protein